MQLIFVLKSERLWVLECVLPKSFCKERAQHRCRVTSLSCSSEPRGCTLHPSLSPHFPLLCFWSFMRPQHSSELWAWIKVSLFTNVRLAGGATIESPRDSLFYARLSLPLGGFALFSFLCWHISCSISHRHYLLSPTLWDGELCCVPIISSPGLFPPLPKSEAEKAHWYDWLMFHLSTEQHTFNFSCTLPTWGHAASMCVRWEGVSSHAEDCPRVSVVVTDLESGVYLLSISAAANDKEPRGIL